MMIMRQRIPFVGLAVLALAVAAACAPQDGGSRSIGAAALAERIAADDAPVVLDVRTPDEYAAGHIPGAVNIPHDELRDRIGELGADRDAEIVVHCQSGGRAAAAEEILHEAGFVQVIDLEGHMQAWKDGGNPVE